MKTSIKVEGLQFSKNYRVAVKAKGGNSDWIEKMKFTFTPAPNYENESDQPVSDSLPLWRVHAKELAN